MILIFRSRICICFCHCGCILLPSSLHNLISTSFPGSCIQKYSVSLKTLLQQGISEPEFYGDCKSALNPPVVCSTDRSKAVVPVLVLLFVALWFILRGDLLYVFPCVILFLCFSVILVLRLPRLGKRELILVIFVRLFGLCLFRFVGFLFLLGSGKGWAAVCDCDTPLTFLLPFFFLSSF